MVNRRGLSYRLSCVRQMFLPCISQIAIALIKCDEAYETRTAATCTLIWAACRRFAVGVVWSQKLCMQARTIALQKEEEEPVGQVAQLRQQHGRRHLDKRLSGRSGVVGAWRLCAWSVALLPTSPLLAIAHALALPREPSNAAPSSMLIFFTLRPCGGSQTDFNPSNLKMSRISAIIPASPSPLCARSACLRHRL